MDTGQPPVPAPGFNAQPHHRRSSSRATTSKATYCIEGETLTVAAIAERLATDRARVSTALGQARKLPGAVTWATLRELVAGVGTRKRYTVRW